MGQAGLRRLAALESWSSTAFLVGGVAWLGFAAYSGLELLGVVTATSALLNDTLHLVGFLAGFVGLAGLHPRVADDEPERARAGVVFATLGAVAHTVDRVAALVVSLASGTPFGAVTTGLEPLYLVTFFCAIVAFLIFSRAASHAASTSRAVSLLLAVLPVGLITALLGVAVVRHRGVLLLGWGAVAVGWLALGYRLRTDDAPANRGGSATDSPA